MADKKIEIDLDPKPVLDSLKDMSDGAKKLSEDIESSLGKSAPKSVEKLTDSAEKGTTKITTMFRNLGTRVKEDLKTAFDVAGIASGLKMGKELGEGVKQVFEMERAFDRLNTRLKLTTAQMTSFKNELGRKVAMTGQKMEDVLPGVETAAAKGGVKDPKQLASIGEMLGQAKATSGDESGALADTVVEILKSQGEKVTAASFKKTMDALQGTRVSGAFHNAEEAGQAVKGLAGTMSPEQMKKMGLGTRELGGLSAMASRGGEHGQDILKKIMETATHAGGKDQLNAIFGQQIFGKNGKMDVGAFGKVDKKRMGEYSEQALGSATGANQADLSRFLDSMKTGMADFKQVTDGANETATQFDAATDNFASKVDKFKENLKESGREIGESVSSLANDVISGNFKKAGADLKKAGKTLWENKGTVAAGVGMSAMGGLLLGGGLNSLLGKIPGGGMAKGMMGAEMAKQAGIQPVYVTNAKDIGGGGTGLAGASGLGGKIAGAAGVVGAAAIGYEIGQALMEIPMFKNAGNSATDWLADKVNGPDDRGQAEQNARLTASFNERNGTSMTPEEFAKAVETGTLAAHKKSGQKVDYTNPSAVKGRGGHG